MLFLPLLSHNPNRWHEQTIRIEAAEANKLAEKLNERAVAYAYANLAFANND